MTNDYTPESFAIDMRSIKKLRRKVSTLQAAQRILWDYEDHNEMVEKVTCQIWNNLQHIRKDAFQALCLATWDSVAAIDVNHRMVAMADLLR